MQHALPLQIRHTNYYCTKNWLCSLDFRFKFSHGIVYMFKLLICLLHIDLHILGFWTVGLFDSHEFLISFFTISTVHAQS